MNVLIVEHCRPLATVWQRHLTRSGFDVTLATTQAEACDRLIEERFNIIFLNVELPDGCALTVSDLAQLRQPQARIIFVTDSNFFSDGSIFTLCANACAYVPSSTRPDDLASMAQHYAQATG